MSADNFELGIPHDLDDEFGETLRSRARDPEQLLFVALLENAIWCLGSRADRREARAWILKDDPQWLFSFVNICIALDIDVGAARKALLGKKCRNEKRGILR